MASLLDPSLYYITEDEAKFLKECTGISDDDELKHHILAVQVEANAVFSYPCVRRLAFIHSKLHSNPAYHQVLDLGKMRENAIMLDIGCGLGNDSRRAIFDGFPLQSVLCTDLRKGENLADHPSLTQFIGHTGFFDIGHKLFKTTPESFPLAFFEGDIFDTEFIYPQTTTVPNLSSLENIGQLKGQVSVIHASAFFHLFDNKKQQQLAQILAQLLLPRGTGPSIILGCQIGAPTHEKALATTGDYIDKIFDPEAWKQLWIGEDGPFKPGDVEVHATCARFFSPNELRGEIGTANGEYYWLKWSVLCK